MKTTLTAATAQQDDVVLDANGKCWQYVGQQTWATFAQGIVGGFGPPVPGQSFPDGDLTLLVRGGVQYCCQ